MDQHPPFLDAPVERVPMGELSAEQFAERFSRPGRPAILTEAWGCVPLHLTVEYLQTRYGEMMLPLDVTSPNRLMARLSEFLEFSADETKGRYLRNLHMCKWFPEELETGRINLPDEFGHNFILDAELPYPPEWSNWFELFVNSKDCAGFPFIHKDTCHTHAFSMQVQGTKRFFLFPDEDRELLYPSSTGAAGTHSQISDLVNVDAEQFPRFREARMSTVDLGPGELLFLPADIWHSTKTVSDEPSVTVGGNFVDGTNHVAFLDAFAERLALASLQ